MQLFDQFHEQLILSVSLSFPIQTWLTKQKLKCLHCALNFLDNFLLTVLLKVFKISPNGAHRIKLVVSAQEIHKAVHQFIHSHGHKGRVLLYDA